MKLALRPIAIALVLLLPAVAEAQADRARHLYYSAAFAEALDALEAQHGPPADPFAIEELRAASLVALGREVEAREVCERLVRSYPHRSPELLAESPATRELFDAARAAVLPEIIREHYVEGTAALEAGRHGDAAHSFGVILQLAAGLPPAATRSVRDFVTLAAEFSRVATAAQQRLAPPDASRVYSVEDAGVTAPVAQKEQVPLPPAEPAVDFSGTALLDVWISADGAVERVSLLQGIHPAYDARILAAAQGWQYTPATLNGWAVRFRKLLQIDVR